MEGLPPQPTHMSSLFSVIRARVCAAESSCLNSSLSQIAPTCSKLGALALPRCPACNLYSAGGHGVIRRPSTWSSNSLNHIMLGISEGDGGTDFCGRVPGARGALHTAQSGTQGRQDDRHKLLAVTFSLCRIASHVQSSASSTYEGQRLCAVRLSAGAQAYGESVPPYGRTHAVCRNGGEAGALQTTAVLCGDQE